MMSADRTKPAPNRLTNIPPAAPQGVVVVPKDETHGANRQTANSPVAERLYKDAIQRAASKRAIETQQGKADKSFSPDLSPTAGYNKSHLDKTKQGSVTERLYKDALRKVDHVREHDKAEAKEVLSMPFKPNLSETADYRRQHPVFSQQKEPASDRLYEDALQRREELQRKEEKLKEKPKKSKEHIHPFATDTDAKADYFRRLDSSLSVDGGSKENGLYEDSSVSSASSVPVTKCECGNIIQIDRDREEQIHPSIVFDGAQFSPDIKESQKVFPSPLNIRVHGEQSKSVFDRLFHDKEQREKRMALQRSVRKMDEDKGLTFQPKTNVRHKQKGAKRCHQKGEGQLCDHCKENGKVAASEERNQYLEFLESEINLAPDEEAIGPALLDPGETFAALSVQK